MYHCSRSWILNLSFDLCVEEYTILFQIDDIKLVHRCNRKDVSRAMSQESSTSPRVLKLEIITICFEGLLSFFYMAGISKSLGIGSSVVTKKVLLIWCLCCGISLIIRSSLMLSNGVNKTDKLGSRLPFNSFDLLSSEEHIVFSAVYLGIRVNYKVKKWD